MLNTRGKAYSSKQQVKIMREVDSRLGHAVVVNMPKAEWLAACKRVGLELFGY